MLAGLLSILMATVRYASLAGPAKPSRPMFKRKDDNLPIVLGRDISPGGQVSIGDASCHSQNSATVQLGGNHHAIKTLMKRTGASPGPQTTIRFGRNEPVLTLWR